MRNGKVLGRLISKGLVTEEQLPTDPGPEIKAAANIYHVLSCHLQHADSEEETGTAGDESAMCTYYTEESREDTWTREKHAEVVQRAIETGREMGAILPTEIKFLMENLVSAIGSVEKLLIKFPKANTILKEKTSI